MEKIKFKIEPKKTKRKMTKEEVQEHHDKVKKSHHVFKNKKKYDRKRDRKVEQ